MPERTKQQRIFSGSDFSLALVRAEANYGDISRFVLSERRTGHRWEHDGPSNPMARAMQLMACFNITLDDALWLIKEGERRAGGGPIPLPVIDLKKQIAKLRSAKGKLHDDEDQKASDRGSDHGRHHRPAQRAADESRALLPAS